MKIIITLLLLVYSQNAYAYVDPGMGSAFIQLIVALVSAIAFYISYTLGLIKKTLKNIKKFFKKESKKDN